MCPIKSTYYYGIANRSDDSNKSTDTQRRMRIAQVETHMSVWTNADKQTPYNPFTAPFHAASSGRRKGSKSIERWKLTDR